MNIRKIRRCITIKLYTNFTKLLCQPLIDHSSISMSAIKLKILTFPNRPAYRLFCITHNTLYINFSKYLLKSLSHPEITNIKLRSSIDNIILQTNLSRLLPILLLLYRINFLSILDPHQIIKHLKIYINIIF